MSDKNYVITKNEYADIINTELSIKEFRENANKTGVPKEWVPIFMEAYEKYKTLNLTDEKVEELWAHAKVEKVDDETENQSIPKDLLLYIVCNADEGLTMFMLVSKDNKGVLLQYSEVIKDDENEDD